MLNSYKALFKQAQYVPPAPITEFLPRIFFLVFKMVLKRNLQISLALLDRLAINLSITVP